MSKRGGLGSPRRRTMSHLGNFSSRSLGSDPWPSRTIPRQGSSYFGFGTVPAVGVPLRAVEVDRSLLTPLKLEVDPGIYALRLQEKEQIKGLNDRFASFIDNVCHLEQQNKMLETKWQLLQTENQATSELEPMLKAYISRLQSQLDGLKRDKGLLEAELQNILPLVEENKQRYEDEINKRYTAENDFVLAKKDVDTAYLGRSSLEDKLAGLQEEFNFLKAFYEKELQELIAKVKDTSVVVQMDNSRQLNMDQIVSDVKRQYEVVSARSRKEVEAWYKRKFELVSSQARLCSSELKSSKSQISELKRHIIRLQSDVTAAAAQCDCVGTQIKEVEYRGEGAVRDARQQIGELEEGVHKAKREMARRLCEYQDLMNTRLALDIEIATYKRLVEGEESRIGQDSIVCVQMVPKPSLAVSH